VSDRSDTVIALLASAAAALVLAAPLLGRSGWPALADAVMASAALCGVAAFALAGRATLRAARRRVGRGAPLPPPRDPRGSAS
jgi:hypothetical protein